VGEKLLWRLAHCAEVDRDFIVLSVVRPDLSGPTALRRLGKRLNPAGPPFIGAVHGIERRLYPRRRKAGFHRFAVVPIVLRKLPHAPASGPPDVYIAGEEAGHGLSIVLLASDPGRRL
jgi:hypothetical protein